MQSIDFPAGAIIFQPGDPGDRAFLIHEGKVELLRGPATSLTRMTRLGPGEVFGEMSLIEERPHSLTARAISAVKASALTREQFESKLTSDPITFRLYLKALFERLRSAPVEAVVEDLIVTAEPIVSVTIHPLTRRAAETLPDDGLLVYKFPFRIGRASEVREPEALDLNDLWLIDREPFSISRNHAVIDLEGDAVVIMDRGSSLGIHVNDVHLGGKGHRRQMSLDDGDNVVIIGGKLSPYQFRVRVSRG